VHPLGELLGLFRTQDSETASRSACSEHRRGNDGSSEDFCNVNPVGQGVRTNLRRTRELPVESSNGPSTSTSAAGFPVPLALNGQRTKDMLVPGEHSASAAQIRCADFSSGGADDSAIAARSSSFRRTRRQDRHLGREMRILLFTDWATWSEPAVRGRVCKHRQLGPDCVYRRYQRAFRVDYAVVRTSA